MSTSDPICPRLPPCCYAKEAWKSGPRIHAFRTIRQRDGWVDQDAERRVLMRPEAAEVHIAWESFSMQLHPDDRQRLKL